MLPALISRFHRAKVRAEAHVVCWGTGRPFREFLHSDDLARALVFLMRHYSEEQFINVGSGVEITISDLATLVARIVGCSGKIVWDPTKPDGSPRKLIDSSRMFALGWKPKIELAAGIALTYADFQHPIHP